MKMLIYIQTDPKHEVKVTSKPVKIYKTKDEFIKDMEVEESRPTRKSYGSVINPGPYQEPLSIAIPPLNPGVLVTEIMSVLFCYFVIRRPKIKIFNIFRL